MFRSITTRLVFLYCILLVLLGGAFLLFTVLSFDQYARATISDSLGARAQAIRETSQNLLNQPDRLKAAIEGRFGPETQDRFIRIRTRGRVIYRSGNPTERDFDPLRVPLLSRAPSTKLVGDLLVYTQTFQQPDGNPLIIDSGQSYRFAHTMERRLAESLLIGLPIMLLTAAAAGYGLMGKALTPVEGMINAAEAYSFNNPNSRLPLVGTEPRIEALGLALNRMLDRLDAAYSHVSRFSADAAHELRTPLTIIRGELELAMTDVRASGDLGEAISNALEEMTRLSEIVDSLITLSRMESLWGKRAHSAIDILELAVETIDQMNLLAVEKQIALARPEGEPVVVAGDRDRLKQVLVNLLDNSIKYTPAGGQVRVNVSCQGDHAYVVIEDTGVGIDAKHHDKIFDRFYRVSPDRGESGAGLGLAIVKSIVHAHGGSVTLRSVPLQGSAFQIALPFRPPV